MHISIWLVNFHRFYILFAFELITNFISHLFSIFLSQISEILVVVEDGLASYFPFRIKNLDIIWLNKNTFLNFFVLEI